MSKKGILWRGKSAFEVLEEGMTLLRSAPLNCLAAYYIGGLPFILGFLYYWADMSHGAFAWRHAIEESLAISLLYGWMKCWQAVFAAGLWSELTEGESEKWNPSRIARLAVAQVIYQPWCLLSLPVGLLLTLPFGWLYAFYHNFSVTGNGRETDPRAAVKKAWSLATLWPAQNHLLISVLFLFALFVFSNVAVLVFWVPHLLKQFLGIETQFVWSRVHALNTSFFAVVIGITYLCVNPLAKAVYVLRCFYGESLHSAADLRAELGRCKKGVSLQALAIFLICLFSAPAFCGPSEPEPKKTDGTAEGSHRVDSHELDSRIQETLQRPEFSWRLPREPQPEKNEKQRGFLSDFIDGIFKTIGAWIKAGIHAMRIGWWRFLKWLDHWLSHNQRPEEGSWPGFLGGWRSWVLMLFIIILGVFLGVLGILLHRAWSKKRLQLKATPIQTIAIKPDLEKEEVQADQLPFEEWETLARELLARGDLRLALRAYYLSALAWLAHCEKISIARFKSNRDYSRELSRRARGEDPLLEAFSRNVVLFEGAWYGAREVTSEIMSNFTANHRAIYDHAKKT